MSSVERRIELAFEFIGDALKNPALLDTVPDGAIVGLGDNDDPELTAESRQLARVAGKESGRLHGLLVRRRSPAGKTSAVEYVGS